MGGAALAAGGPDPVLETWGKAFPGVLKESREMSLSRLASQQVGRRLPAALPHAAVSAQPDADDRRVRVTRLRYDVPWAARCCSGAPAERRGS